MCFLLKFGNLYERFLKLINTIDPIYVFTLNKIQPKEVVS